MWLINKIGILLIGLCSLRCTSPAKTTPKTAGVQVPTEWVEKVRHYDYKKDNLSLLKDFEQFIEPDTLDGASESLHLGKGLVEPRPASSFTPLFVNLDEEPSEELIGVLRYARCKPMLFVVKMIGSSWYLLHHESIFVHNEEPELLVANSPSANKTFYVRALQESGSGIYRDSYRFYKLIDNKVVLCLEVPNEAKIYGWGLYLNQEVNLALRFASTGDDAIETLYKYSFFPGPVLAHDMSWSAHPEIYLVKGEGSAFYKWNASTMTYQYETFGSESPDELTKSKIATFGDFGNDSLFVRAYAYEIGEMLHEGTPVAKQLLNAYLTAVKHGRKSTVHLEELEEKKAMNGTRFYGPKPK